LRAREAVLLPSLSHTATGLLLWLSGGHGAGMQGGPKAWEPILRSLDLPGLRVLILDPRELMDVADDLPSGKSRSDWAADDGVGSVVSVFKDGQPVGLGTAPTATAARLAPPGLDALLQQSDAEGQLRDLLGRAAATVGDVARSAAPLGELFALIALAPGAEDRQRLLLGARRVREAALAQAASLSANASAADTDNAAHALERVIIGGFQRGGELALLAGLAMAVDPLPRKVGGVVAINAHLPLAAEIGQALVVRTAQLQAQHAADKFSRLTSSADQRAAPLPAMARSALEAALPSLLLRAGGRDEVVEPMLTELTARALYSAGAAVNFDVVENSSHNQWDVGHLSDVRSFALGLLRDAAGV
jgi:predicted esterase